MQNCPTIPRLVEMLRITEDQAKRIRAIVKREVHFDKEEDFSGLPKTDHWWKQCMNFPKWRDTALHAMDEILENHGIEAIYLKRSGDLAISYSNTGDPYTMTVMFDHQVNRFLFGSWGDIVEKHPNRYH